MKKNFFLNKVNLLWLAVCIMLGIGVSFLYIYRVPGNTLFLCFLTVGIVVLRFFLARKKMALWPVTVMLLILAIGAYFIHVSARLTKFIATGRVASYHYFLGSKYFEELGYYGLYRYSVLADHESEVPRLSRKVKHIRHLEDLSTMSVKDAIAKAEKEKWDYFSKERWHEFKGDWGPMVKGSTEWERKLNDHGFNPSPFWNFIPGMVAQHVRTTDKKRYTFVRLIDLILFLILLGVASYFTGLDGALTCYIFVNAAVVLYYRHGFVDTFFQFQWFNALIATMVFYRLGKMKLAGVSLAYAGMVRIFPLVLVAGPGIVWLRKLIQTRILPKKETAFLASFVIAATIFGLLGLTQGKGLISTRQFLQNITFHADFIKFDGNKFGLKRLMSIDLSEPFKAIGRKTDRVGNFEDNRAVYYFLWALLVGLSLAAMCLHIDDDAWVIPLGVGLIFALMTASRYYYLMLVVFLIPGREKQNSWFATLSISTIFLVHALFIFYRGDRYGAFTLGNFGFLFGFIIFTSSLLLKKYLDHRCQIASTS